MRVLFVISGKGGVGKSTFSVLLSFYLNRIGRKVSLLDLDICGPSLSCFLGIKEVSIVKNQEGLMIPYKYSEMLNALSMSFLLSDPDTAVIWRGPRKNALVKEMCGKVAWGDSDILIIDTPPGIQDEHITLAETFYNNPNVEAIMITTPHDLSIDDVSRQITFCKKTGIKILGMIENMKNFECPHCKHCVEIFHGKDIKNFCSVHNIIHLGEMKLFPKLSELLDNGQNYFDHDPDSDILNLFDKISNNLNLC